MPENKGITSFTAIILDVINFQSWSHQDAQVHVRQLSACSVQINIQIS